MKDLFKKKKKEGKDAAIRTHDGSLTQGKVEEVCKKYVVIRLITREPVTVPYSGISRIEK